MPAFLVPVEPGLCVIPLEKAIVLIGRESDCDVSLTQSRKVSRKHCCLAQVNNKIVARDLGSTNGIFLNGARVKKECQVKLGDELMIGDLRFRLQVDPKSQRVSRPAVASPPPSPRTVPEEDALATYSAKPAPYQKNGFPDPALSMDIPVILPEEGRDFAVEPSIPRMPSPRRYPARDESGPLVPYQNGSSEGDVIPLGTDSI